MDTFKYKQCLGNQNPVLWWVILDSFRCLYKDAMQVTDCALSISETDSHQQAKISPPLARAKLISSTPLCHVWHTWDGKWLMSEALRWKFSCINRKFKAFCIAGKWLQALPFDLSFLSDSWSFLLSQFFASSFFFPFCFFLCPLTGLATAESLGQGLQGGS